MEHPLELYKIRSLSERFSATADFVRTNRKVIFRNILPVGAFLVVLMSLFSHAYFRSIYSHSLLLQMGEATPLEINWFAYSGMLLFSLLLSLYIYSLSGALLNRYAAGRLTPDTHWSDLRSTFFAIAGRLSAQTGIAMLLLVVVAFIAGLLISLGESGPGQLPVVGLIFTAFFLLMLVALIPSLSLMQYPIYLELASGWSAIKKGFRLGFRHWRSTLLTAFLGVLITIAVFYIAAMPYVLYLIFNIVHLGWGGVPLLFVPYAILLFLIPISVFFMAFQYTSIAEKEKKDRARESVG